MGLAAKLEILRPKSTRALVAVVALAAAADGYRVYLNKRPGDGEVRGRLEALLAKKRQGH